MATTLAVAVPAPPFLLAIEFATGRIAVHGELDRDHAHRLVEAVRVLTRSTALRWSLDISALEFCDVAGLRAICHAQRLATDSGRRLVVTGPRPFVRRLLDFAGVPVADTEGAAATSVPSPQRRLDSSSAVTRL